MRLSLDSSIAKAEKLLMLLTFSLWEIPEKKRPDIYSITSFGGDQVNIRHRTNLAA